MNYISLSRNFLPLQGKIFRDKFLCYERLIFSSVLEIIIIQNLCQIVLIFSETLFKCSKEYLNYLSRWRCSDQSTHRHMFTITMEAAMFYLLDKSYTQLDFRVSVKSIPTGRGNKENFRCLSGMGFFLWSYSSFLKHHAGYGVRTLSTKNSFTFFSLYTSFSVFCFAVERNNDDCS